MIQVHVRHALDGADGTGQTVLREALLDKLELVCRKLLLRPGMTVLDIGTSMGDGAQLGHASSLHTGQAVPAGERWHGSPAQPTDVDYRAAGPADCGTWRRAIYSVLQLLRVLLVNLPLAFGGLVALFTAVPWLAALDSAPPALTSGTFYRGAMATTFVLFDQPARTNWPGVRPSISHCTLPPFPSSTV